MRLFALASVGAVMIPAMNAPNRGATPSRRLTARAFSMNDQSERYRAAAMANRRMQRIRQVSFASLVPLYFAIVGLRLDLTRGFAVALFVASSRGPRQQRPAACTLGATRGREFE